ncbi:baseplate tail tube cap [Vibrio phage EniLVp02]
MASTVSWDTSTQNSRTSFQNKKGRTVETLTYPPSIISDGVNSNFLVLRSMRMNSQNRNTYFEARRRFTSNDAQTMGFETEATINLYMPNLVENLSQNYDDAVQSLFGQFVAELGNVNSLDELGTVASKGAGMMIGTAARSVLGLFNDAYQQQTGRIVTGNMIGAYKGPTRRTQVLVFNFNPKTLAELETVGKIIKAFYKGALPSVRAGLEYGESIVNKMGSAGEGVRQSLVTYSIPNLWMLEEVSDSNGVKHIPRFVFGPAAITNLRLNKTPDQYWRTFKNTLADPASIELELTFTEMFPLDRTTYENDISSSVKGYQGDRNT